MKTQLTLALSLVTSVASAQGLELTDEPPHTFEVSGAKKRLESPRHMYFEAKLSPFTPLIDRLFPDDDGVDPREEKPYFDTFGGGPMLLGEIEFEYQFFQKFGSLAGGLSVGYAEKFGKAVNAVTGERTDGSTGLIILPLKALLVYRWDWAKEKFHVPLVPYAKAAFVTMPWWVVNGGTVEIFGVDRGEGVKFGLSGVLGLAVELDFLDQRLSRDFDSSMGVNHTYVFAEATLQEMNLFPTPQNQRAMDLSSRHFMFGLAFEF